jgi:hypothetical protein
MSPNVQAILEILKSNPQLVKRLAQVLDQICQAAGVELTDEEKAELLSAIARAATPKAITGL